MSINISMRQMLEAGVHFGHQTRYWNPKMAPFIFGARQKIHIINLEETLPRFRDALLFIHRIAAKNGRVLFVGTKPSARDVIREEATRCDMPYVDHRWLGGMLTNYKTIRQSIKRLEALDEKLADQAYLEGITKKEALQIMREREKLNANLAGIRKMGGLPDMLFIIDVGTEKIAIQEARRLKIPVVGIVDTNTSPEGLDIAIPGNDDAVRAIRFYCKAVADVIIQARGEMELQKAKEAVEKAKAEPAKKEPAKKIVTKKAKVVEAASKVAVKKTVKVAEKKPVAKKAETKTAAKKTVAKKTAAKKPTAKKVVTKKVVAKKTTKKATTKSAGDAK